MKQILAFYMALLLAGLLAAGLVALLPGTAKAGARSLAELVGLVF